MTCGGCYAELGEGARWCHICGRPIARIAPALRYAGFWLRVAAVILDLMLIMGSPVFFVFDHVVGPETKEEQEATKDLLRHRLAPDASRYAEAKFIDRQVRFAQIVFEVGLPYYVLAECSAWQGTIGKRLLGLRVTDLSGRRIRLRRAILRYLCRILSALPFQFGFCMAAFTTRKRALHDFAAGTMVVRSEHMMPPWRSLALEFRSRRGEVSAPP